LDITKKMDRVNSYNKNYIDNRNYINYNNLYKGAQGLLHNMYFGKDVLDLILQVIQINFIFSFFFIILVF
jgi:hypothetical protein